MALYEHVFLARQDISTAQVNALTKEFTGIITENGGKIAKTEYWGLKGLAYKIKKSRKAHYTLLNIDAPPAAVAEMERRMGLSTDVIRHLTIRVDEHDSAASVQMRKFDRDERPGFKGKRGGPGGFKGGPRGGGPRGGPPRGGPSSDSGPPRGGPPANSGPRGDSNANTASAPASSSSDS